MKFQIVLITAILLNINTIKAENNDHSTNKNKTTLFQLYKSEKSFSLKKIRLPEVKEYVTYTATIVFLGFNPTGEASNTFNPNRVLGKAEFGFDAKRFYLGFSGSFGDVALRNKTTVIIDETEVEFTRSNHFRYDDAYLTIGYAALFLDQFRIHPYMNFGIASLETAEYETENGTSTQEIYSGFSAGAGVRIKYLFMEEIVKQRTIYYIPTIFGVVIDAGYNFLPSTTIDEFKGNMFYFGFGINFGFTGKKRLR